MSCNKMLMNPHFQNTSINFNKFNAQTFVDDTNLLNNFCNSTFNKETINNSVASTSKILFDNNALFNQNLNTYSTLNYAENLLQNSLSNNNVSDSQTSLFNTKNTSSLNSTSSNNVLDAAEIMRKREIEIAEFLVQSSNQQLNEQKLQNFISSLNNLPEVKTQAFKISDSSLSLNSNIPNSYQQEEEIVQQKHSANKLVEQFLVSFFFY